MKFGEFLMCTTKISHLSRFYLILVDIELIVQKKWYPFIGIFVNENKCLIVGKGRNPL